MPVSCSGSTLLKQNSTPSAENDSACATGAWCGYEPCGAPPRWWKPPAYRPRLHSAGRCCPRAEGWPHCRQADRAAQGHSHQGQEGRIEAWGCCSLGELLALWQVVLCWHVALMEGAWVVACKAGGLLCCLSCAVWLIRQRSGLSHEAHTGGSVEHQTWTLHEQAGRHLKSTNMFVPIVSASAIALHGLYGGAWYSCN